MALARHLVPGQGLTWQSPWSPDAQVRPGERGVFLDYDGSPDSYVVEFSNNRLFCCQPSDVIPDPKIANPVRRRHTAT